MAVITYDGTSSSGYKAATSSYSWLSHSVTTNEPSIFIVRVAIFVSGSVSSITLGGVNLSFLRAKANGVYRIETWYLTEPPTGVNTVSVTLSGSLTSSASEVVYYNVNATSPFNDQGDNTGTGNPASDTQTPSSADPMIVGGLVTPTTSGITDQIGQTQRSEVNGTLGSLVISDIFGNTLLTNLGAYYKFDEDTGTTTADATGNGNTGTLENSPTWVPGKINSGIELVNASQQYINCGTALAPIFQNASWSISGWIYFTNNSGSVEVLCGIGATGATDEVLQIHKNSNKLVVAFYSDDSTGTTTLAANTWYHIVVTFNASTKAKIAYLNGNVEINVTSSGVLDVPNNSVFYIGRDYAGAPAYSDSIIDEVGIWSRVLTSSEAAQLYNSGAGLQYPFVPSSMQLLWNGIGSLDTWASTGLTLNESTVVPVQSKYNMLMMGI